MLFRSCLVSDYEENHVFWFFAEDSVESVTLGKGVVLKEDDGIAIKFKKGLKSWVLKKYYE